MLVDVKATTLVTECGCVSEYAHVHVCIGTSVRVAVLRYGLGVMAGLRIGVTERLKG